MASSFGLLVCALKTQGPIPAYADQGLTLMCMCTVYVRCTVLLGRGKMAPPAIEVKRLELC